MSTGSVKSSGGCIKISSRKDVVPRRLYRTTLSSISFRHPAGGGQWLQVVLCELQYKSH